MILNASGIIITLAYIGGTLYLQQPLESLTTLPPSELGDFLSGIFAPLAFLWLVIGYIQNNKSINQNNQSIQLQEKALKLQTEELKNSVNEMKEANKTSAGQLESIKNNEKLNKRDLFFRYFEIQTQELNEISVEISRRLKNTLYDGFRGKSSATGYNDGHRSYFLLITDCMNHFQNLYLSETSTKNINDEGLKAIKSFLNKYSEIKKHAKAYDKDDELLSLVKDSIYEDFSKILEKIKVKYDKAI